MKVMINKNLAILFALIITSLVGFAQTPQGFSYQAVVRNGNGTPIVDKTVGLRITLQNASQVVYYTETHSPLSNAQGVISVTIGGGTQVGVQTFASIPWELGNIYIKAEIDPNGGNTYTPIGGPTELQSVPYALHANNTKEVVSLPNASDDEPIFVVRNKEGKIVFAVYQTGVRVYVEDSPIIKGAKGGFAVGGLTLQAKGEPAEYLRITSDSARIYVNEKNAKGAKGGFAVGGLTLQAKTIQSRNLMFIGQDSARIYIDDTSTPKGAKGGFAVGGLTLQAKGLPAEYMRITSDSARIYVNEKSSKGAKGGFAVGGLTLQAKAIKSRNLMYVAPDSTRIYINNSLTKGAKGGFAVGGLTLQAKGGGSNNFIEVMPDSTRIFVSSQTNASSVGGFSVKSTENLKTNFFNISSTPSAKIIKNESRVMWYPTRSALLAGEISVLHPDSVGQFSMSLGYRNIAKGNYSQAMGYKSIARGNYSTAMGFEAVAGENAFSFGSGSKALGLGSFAFGAQGVDVNGVIQNTFTEATGNFSFAFGLGSKAKGLGAFVLGINCEANNKFSTAMGFSSIASGVNSIAMGLNSTASGPSSTAIGVNNTSSGSVAFTMGSGNNATALYSFAIGANNNANGQSSLAFGQGNTAGGLYSVVGGYQNVATGNFSFAVGSGNSTIGDGSIAVGTSNSSGGVASAAFGDGNTASGTNSFVVGYHTKASGQNSVAMGNTTEAIYDNAIAFGDSTSARGYGSIASGFHVAAKAYASMVLGRYNTLVGNPSSWLGGDPIFVIGNGTSVAARNDALVIYKNGSIKVDGNLYPNDATGSSLGTLSNRWDVVYAINGTIQTSDARLKKDIYNLSYGLKDILKLRPVSFIWKEGQDQSVKLGLIAQEVQPIINEVVNVGDDQNKTLGINYTSLIPVLINSIQEQQKIIEEQKAKNTILENQINEINKKLEELEKRVK